LRVKIKFTIKQATKAHRGSRGIALLFLDLSTRKGWVVSTTPRLLYPQERPGTRCTGSWVGPMATTTTTTTII
jgi:hypothetical protein